MGKSKSYTWLMAINHNMHVFHQSIIGRILSISTILIITAISWVLLLKFLVRSDKDLRYYREFTDLSIGETKVNFINEDQLAFKIVIRASNDIYSGDDIRDIFNITFLESSRYIEKGYPKYNYTDLSFDKWSEFDFKDESQIEIPSLLNKFEYWFNITNGTVAGDLTNPNILKSLHIDVKFWKGDNCTDPTLYGPTSLSIEVISQQKYVDLNDIENPSKSYYREESFVDFTKAHISHTDTFKAERNTIKLEDTWWEFLFGSTTINFKTLSFEQSFEERPNIMNGSYSIVIGLSSQSNLYQRKMISFMEIFGLIGGLIIWSQLFCSTIPSFVLGSILNNKFKKELAWAQSELKKVEDSILKIKNISKNI